MNSKQAALIKLATVRCAINHVLRMRAMQKQAESPYARLTSPEQKSVNILMGADPKDVSDATRKRLLSDMESEFKKIDDKYKSIPRPAPTWHNKVAPGAEFLDYNPYTGQQLSGNKIYPPAMLREVGAPLEGSTLPRWWKDNLDNPIHFLQPPGKAWDNYPNK